MRLSPRIRDAVRQLVVADLSLHLPGEVVEAPIRPTIETLGTLLTVASAFACSDRDRERMIAYEIATRVLGVTGDTVPGYVSAVSAILSRLGNFPGRELLGQRYGREWDLPLYLQLESTVREQENTISEHAVPLTDFQYDLYQQLLTATTLSVSAPTSAGKTYILALAIAEKLRRKRDRVIVYVVPTRALMRQVMLRVADELASLGLSDISVRCVFLPITSEAAERGVVYVVTQERLLSMLNNEEACPAITTLIVDEAQTVGDGSRGVVLQTAIDSVLARFPSTELYFASPLAANPEYLVGLFARGGKEDAWNSSLPPVTQNCVLVKPRVEDPSSVQFDLITRTGPIRLGIRQLGFQFRGPKAVRRAKFALAVTQDTESTLIYANEPSDAEAIALVLADELPASDEGSNPLIEEFITYLSDFVHPDYPLIKCLQRRVAFHYGLMPASVRTRRGTRRARATSVHRLH